MRKYSIALLALVLLIGYSCKKKDLITNFDSLTQGSYLTLTKINNTNIDYSALSTSTVSIQVGSKGAAVDKVNVYVTPEPTLDKTKWKLVKAIPFTEGVNLDVKATEIATALGIPPNQLEPGSQYTLYNEVVTKDGRTFSSINTDADFEGQAGYNMAFHWTATVICPFTSSTVAGTYTVITDEWADWGAGDQVQVTAGPGANQVNLSQVWPNPAAGGTVTNPLLINVTPATGAVTVPAGVTIAHYTGFGGYDLATASGSFGFIFSCTNTINVTIHLTTPQFGDQGFLQLVLKK
jgi:hypothetical protein